MTQHAVVDRHEFVGADGVVPGSLVFGEPDPRQAVAEIHALRPGDQDADLSAFWAAKASA